ncbi:hypothetical protein NC651_036002 [Populus alba x Populus x berolinensis]|nr:hypothetical protein NC651_036002 [Populus alba x Populus x berolinensis]
MTEHILKQQALSIAWSSTDQVSPRVPLSTSLGIFHRPERVLSSLLKCLGELLVSFDVNNPLITSSENTSIIITVDGGS